METERLRFRRKGSDSQRSKRREKWEKRLSKQREMALSSC